MNRCLNDIFGYCDGKPDRYWSDEEATAYDSEGQAYHEPLRVRRCRRDYHTCGQYLTQTQFCALTIK